MQTTNQIVSQVFLKEIFLKHLSKSLLTLACLTSLSSCSTLPGSGPNASDVNNLEQSNYAKKIQQKPSSDSKNQAEDDVNSQALVMDLSREMNERLARNQQRASFVDSWGDSGIKNDKIGVGDVLEVSVWEAAPAVLFSASPDLLGTSQVTRLPDQVVDYSGNINIPFAGSVVAKGRTNRQIEQDVVQKLKTLANQPQVMVRLMSNNSSNVTIIREGRSLRMPLTARGERVLDAVAAIDGVTQAADKTAIQLTRGKRVVSLPLSVITRDLRQNIRLKPGDVISALNKPLSFTVLGATGKNQEVDFEGQGISLVQALARTGGLNDNRADAKGVFIFRHEDRNVVNLSDSAFVGDTRAQIPVIYRANLVDPNAFFHAKDFMVQDKDILYVSNAKSTELKKFLSIISSATSPVNSVIDTSNNF